MHYDPQPLAPLAAALRRGDRTPTALVEDLCDRLDAVEGDVRAFRPETGRRTRLAREATATAARYPDPGDRPPLFGVPVGVKDIFHVDGHRTHAGSSLPPAALSGPGSAAFEALADAGALMLGKTHTAEFAYFEPPPTRNPSALDHTPGGSSSGSAAAVAAGECPLALGTQTVGSVIRPAAFCGVVGYKPSYGRIPREGVIDAAPSVDHVGTFAPDVAGTRRAAGVLCADWEPATPDARPILGVPEGPYLDQAAAAGHAGLEAAVDALADAGYEVRQVPTLDDIEAVNDRHERLVAAEMALTHTAWYDDYADRYADATADLVERGQDIDVGELVAARNGRKRLRARIAERLEGAGVDLLVSPAAPGPAPEGIDDTGDPVMNLPWTHAGVPAVTVPCGRVGDRPLGLQVVGRFGADEALLAWAGDMADAVDDAGDVTDRG
jgi:Asp-tRNA(Asn)/Glu-tRNA(Gln) amidotransferase A subunit family amidase